MHSRGCVVLTGVALLFLGLAAFPGAQSRVWAGGAQEAPAVSQIQKGCKETEAAAQELCRIDFEGIRRKLQARFQGMEEALAGKEAEIGPRLRAKLDGLSAELESEREELSSRANEIAGEAARLAEQMPSIVLSEEESGWLGIEIAEVTPEKAKELKLSALRGVLVVSVEPKSPAAKAGLKSEDIITQYDRQEVEGTVQLRRLVRETPPGRTIPLTISRAGRAQDLSVEVGDRRTAMGCRMRYDHPRVFSPPSFEFHFGMPEFFDGRAPMLGISAEEVSGQLGEYFGAPGGEGVLVREVRPGTPAEKAGLKAGDVITKVDGREVRTVGELREQLRTQREQKTVTLSVIRKGAEMNLSVAIEAPHSIEQRHFSRRVTL